MRYVLSFILWDFYYRVASVDRPLVVESNHIPSPVFQVGDEGSHAGIQFPLGENEKSRKDVSPYGIRYSWVDAFRTSLCSNSQKIADFLRRFADLDLVA